MDNCKTEIGNISRTGVKLVKFRFQHIEGVNHYYITVPGKEEEEVTFNDYFPAMRLPWSEKFDTDYKFEYTNFSITLAKYKELYPYMQDERTKSI